MSKHGTYKIRHAVTGGHDQYAVTVPPSIAAPLHEAGFRVRYEVRDEGILIILVPSDERLLPDDTTQRVNALMERYSTNPNTQEVQS
jgi:hypothetical protein